MDDDDDDDVLSLIDSFNPGTEIVVGEEMFYTEGIVRAKVKVLNVSVEEEHEEYKLEVLEQIGRFSLPKIFECGRKKGYEGWCGWSLRKIRND